MAKHLFIVSTSTVHGKKYLEYLAPKLPEFYADCTKVLFIPYARPGGISHDDYTQRAAEFFSTLNIEVRGIHTFETPEDGIDWADGFFTGGGNTFVLIKALHEGNIIEPLRAAVESGKPYMGSSAGSNITGISVSTTNDMPIVYPPSFEALQFVPFNINPHYLDPDPGSKHMGETRETRIKEFHVYNNQPVVGLREGSALEVHGNTISLWGELSARIFEKDKTPYELSPEDDFSFLLNA